MRVSRFLWRFRYSNRGRHLAALVACLAFAALYMAAAVEVAFGLHIGHVVQDGVDTGDVLALPLVVMAVICVCLGMVCVDGMGGRRRRRLHRL